MSLVFIESSDAELRLKKSKIKHAFIHSNATVLQYLHEGYEVLLLLN